MHYPDRGKRKKQKQTPFNLCNLQKRTFRGSRILDKIINFFFAPQSCLLKFPLCSKCCPTKPANHSEIFIIQYFFLQFPVKFEISLVLSDPEW